LRIVQDEQGWIDTASIDAIAEYLAMSAIAVYEVASFYNMYNLKPVGKYKLTVCTNLPCALSGGNEAAAYIKQKLGIEINETTADGRFTLQEGECMGACGDAPVMLVSNRKMCSFMSHEAIDRLLEELK
jgi:NADH-quinone oxidoreductase subunit E